MDDVDLVGETGSRVLPKLPRLLILPRFVGVLGSLSIGTAGAKALLCTRRAQPIRPGNCVQLCATHTAQLAALLLPWTVF